MPIERILGAGGMGCVLLCQNQNHLIEQKKVVVKCFWETLKGNLMEVFKEPFAMKNLPCVPKPLDYGYADNLKEQRAYFVTEYIEGAIDGETWLEKEGVMDLETGLAVALQIAKGLHLAHEKGTYHMDMKPANILLKRTKSGIEVKIIDFGLSQGATSLGEYALQKSHSGLSSFGQAVIGGTLDYAPPEQQSFERYKKPSAKNDLFSFGATMYRLFTHKKPRPFRERNLPNVPTLRDLLCDCVEDDQKNRPESAQEIVTQLEKIQAQLTAPEKPAHSEQQQTQAQLTAPEKPAKEAHSEQIQQQTVLPKEEKKGKFFQFEVVTVNAKGEISNRKQKQAFCQTEELGNGVVLEMVEIPGGTFTMGSTEYSWEQPQHSVTIEPFYLGKYPVTQAQWEAVMGNNPSHFKGKNRPVEMISWDDAVAFCEQLSKKTGKAYRLPSEAEWEYSCRAGTTTPFYFGETITTDLANYDGNYTYGSAPKGKYRKQTTDVGSFPPNAFGLYDMHGNVWEWCADPWHDNYEGAPTDGSVWEGDSSDRLLRGGSWHSNPDYCRCALRSRHKIGDDERGLRLALSVAAWT